MEMYSNRMKKVILILLALLPCLIEAQTTFLEPGGDADFLIGTTNGFWGTLNFTPSIATDHVHGGHIKSIKYRTGNADVVISKAGIVSDAGARISFWIYLVALPTTAKAHVFAITQSGGNSVVRLYMTTAGGLQLWKGSAAA